MEAESTRSEPARNKPARTPLSGGLAVVFAAVLAGLLLWVAMRPLPKASSLTSSSPRPDLLDRPYRHEFARATPSAAAAVRH